MVNKDLHEDVFAAERRMTFVWNWKAVGYELLIKSTRFVDVHSSGNHMSSLHNWMKRRKRFHSGIFFFFSFDCAVMTCVNAVHKNDVNSRNQPQVKLGCGGFSLIGCMATQQTSSWLLPVAVINSHSCGTGDRSYNGSWLTRQRDRYTAGRSLWTRCQDVRWRQDQSNTSCHLTALCRRFVIMNLPEFRARVLSMRLGWSVDI